MASQWPTGVLAMERGKYGPVAPLSRHTRHTAHQDLRGVVGGAAVAFGPWARMLGQEAPAGVALAVDPTGAGLDA